jgi:hypothetical protein
MSLLTAELTMHCCGQFFRRILRLQQRRADKIRWMLGAKRLTTSGSSSLGLRQTAFASGLAPDPRGVIKVFFSIQGI